MLRRVLFASVLLGFVAALAGCSGDKQVPPQKGSTAPFDTKATQPTAVSK